MMKMKFLTRKQKGIGLLELMLALAVIALLLVMATRYYLSTSRMAEVNEVYSTMQGLALCKIDATKHSTFVGYDLNDCVTNTGFPIDVVASDKAIKTPWGDATITTSASPNVFTVAIPIASAIQGKELCLKLGCGDTMANTITDTSATMTYDVINAKVSAII